MWQSHIWRHAQGNWSNWDMSAISPGTVLWELAEDDGTIWFTGDKYINNSYAFSVVAKYNSAFTFYNGNDIPEIENNWSIIPVPGWEGLYFGSHPGFVEFSGGGV
jgi:hypothetical protein